MHRSVRMGWGALCVRRDKIDDGQQSRQIRRPARLSLANATRIECLNAADVRQQHKQHMR